MESQKMEYGRILRLIVRNFDFMRGRRLLFVAGGILGLGKLAMSFLIPFLYRQLIAMASSPMDPAQLLRTVGAPFAALLALAPLVCLGGYWQKQSAHIAAANMQKTVFGHIVRMDVQSMETGRGDKLTRATENAQGAARMLGGYVIQFLFMFAIYFGGALVLLLISDWRFALAGVLLSAAVLWLSTFLNVRLRGLEQNAQKAEASAASRLLELVTNLPIVKLYLLESPLTGQFRQAGETAYQSRMRYKQLRGVTDGAMDFLSYGAQSAAILAGLTLVPGLDFANLIYLAGLLDVMLTGVRQLGFFIQFIQGSIVSSQRMYELLDQPMEADRPTRAEPDMDHEYAAVFENVDFSYTPERPVLRGLNLSIRRGQTTAIVGPSGCGKSTLIRLLARLYAPDSGEIRLFGAPQSALSNRDIRQSLALIPQEPGLFDGTVAENLRLGNASATPEDIEAALQAASLNDLPEGADTPVGENGSKLSGGQRQRVAIARALLRGAPLCLTDEATSALDISTEEAVQAALRSVNRGRTVVCVAHRLSTIADADVIVYMEDGRVMEQGTHQELVARRGGYWRLVQAGQ